MTTFFPLKAGSVYLMRYAHYTSGILWEGTVQAVSNTAYLINNKWYEKSEFERRWKVFEEIEKIRVPDGAIEYKTK